MKKFILAAAALVAGLAANAQTYVNTTWAAAATANNCTWNTPNFDYTGGTGESSVTDGTLTLQYAGQGSDAAGFIKTADATIDDPGAGYVRFNKSSGNSVKVAAASGSVVTITFRNQKSSAQTITVATGTGNALTLDAKGGANATASISVTAGAEGYIVVNIPASSIDVKSYSISGSSAVNEAAAEGDKEVVARVGLVNVYNDGSKELAK
ncbi:MAG: hypothetical protein IJR32_02660 [Paludibacteraceae bacterium]|nr:hypothetical protein [Paludibacteraceae bacterium]